MSISPSRFLPLNAKTLFSTAVLTVLISYTPVVSADVTYGPIQAKDTLSRIVNRFYVGTNQSSLALMEKIVAGNPGAFVRGDMNRLKLNALLALPGSDWLVNESRFVTPEKSLINQEDKRLDPGDFVNRSPQQMQDRIVFLEAERLSLISQVESLKKDTVRLEVKIKQLERDSHSSDEQLRVLDKEIIRLTQLLENKNGAVVSSSELSQLAVLQEKLQTVQQETELLRSELAKAHSELENNGFLKTDAAQAIKQLTQENSQLQHLLQESQPGVHYFGETSDGYHLNLLGGKLSIPLWAIILGGALLSLVMIALLATRRKSLTMAEPVKLGPKKHEAYDSLLETIGDDEERGFAQVSNKPEENVFKMFDEGTLEMDLKLDMAEAYLQVSDFDSARSILQEVIDGGSELQQRKAARLMKKAA